MHNVDACFAEYDDEYESTQIECVDERGFGELRVTRRYGPIVQRDDGVLAVYRNILVRSMELVM